MLAVFRERGRHRHPVRLLADRDVDPEGRKGRVQPLVELGDGKPVDELEGLHLSPVGRDHQPVIDEVEVDLEGDTAFCMHLARRQATHVDVQRDVPPVVSWSGGGHTHLADDLRPQVQRVLCLLPSGQRELGELSARPLGRAHGRGFPRTLDEAAPLVPTTKPTSSMKHQLHSSPGSAERTMGWLASRACRLACRLGEESQQPIFAQVMHIRRCSHELPVFRHSSQPSIDAGSSITWIWSRWLQVGITHHAPLRRPRR